MRKFVLYCGASKEEASGIGAIIFVGDTSQAITYPHLDMYNKQTKKYFVNFENLKGRLIEIVQCEEVRLSPFGIDGPPFVYKNVVLETIA